RELLGPPLDLPEARALARGAPEAVRLPRSLRAPRNLANPRRGHPIARHPGSLPHRRRDQGDPSAREHQPAAENAGEGRCGSGRTQGGDALDGRVRVNLQSDSFKAISPRISRNDTDKKVTR